MPRYFFHVRNSIGNAEDEEGRDLSSLEEARREAVKGIRSIISDEVKQGLIDLRGEITVTDEDGAAVLKLRFEEAVELRREGET